jgi:hypothetical protein
MTWLSLTSVLVLLSAMTMLTECAHPAGHDDLATRLAAADYRQLVSESSTVAETLWAGGANAQALTSITLGPAQAERVRFLALELSWTRLGHLPEGISKQAAATLIASALRHTPFEGGNWGLAGNDWGFLWYLEADGYEGARSLGQRLISLGKDAVEPLAPLLDDASSVEYEGSKEAMVGNDLGYRVKDVAAYFIGRITGEPMKYDEDITQRDQGIQAMKARLKK